MRKLIVVFLLVSCTPQYTIKDLVMLRHAVENNEYIKHYDLNKDGLLNETDLQMMRNILSEKE